jgi:hypothetical protein
MRLASDTRLKVCSGEPLRVRRLYGRESEAFRAQPGAVLVAVVELAVTIPLAMVKGREAALAEQLRQAERAGPEAARQVLASLNR